MKNFRFGNYERNLKESVVREILDSTARQDYIPKEDAVCSICLEEFDKPLICQPDNCEHYFHCDCLIKIRPDKYGVRHCPLCRTEIHSFKHIQYITNKFGKSAASKHQSAFGKRVNKRVKNVNRGNLKSLVKDLNILNKIK